MDVVTLGETMLRFSPPLGDTLEGAASFQADPGGAESNVAVALARLGLRAGWVSRLPDNALGQRVAGAIRRHGVDTSRVIWAPGERVGTYYIDPGRPPRATQVIYDRAGSAFSRLEPDQVDWGYIQQAAWLHLTGITPSLGDGPRRTVEQAIDTALRHDRVVSFDINYRARLWTPDEAAAALAPLLARVTVIQSTLRDTALLFGTPPDFGRAARALFERFHPRLVLITGGEAGAVAYDGTEHRALAIPTETVDRVGSGDAFAAGFIAGYRRGGLAQGLAWATGLAALKRTYRGDLLWASAADLQAVLAGPGQNIVR